MRKWQTSLEEFKEPFINLTPLIDVVFVVLITFMLIAPLLDIDQIDLASSGTSKENKVLESALRIYVKKGGTITFQKKTVSLQELKTLLEKEKRFSITPQVFLDQSIPFGLYQDLKNLLEEIGFSQMDIVLSPR